ncbi:MAG: hypothetical protein KDK91_20340 [Gammaproteobacteria bacterium]|nr:hypothetical protein [Gammaproteobacteria bacterium]
MVQREITINASYIDADVSNLLTWVPLWGVANVEEQAAGGRIAVKDSGGGVIPFWPTRHHVLAHEGSWTWFNSPTAIYTSGGKIITGGVSGVTTDAILVSGIDTTTGGGTPAMSVQWSLDGVTVGASDALAPTTSTPATAQRTGAWRYARIASITNAGADALTALVSSI